MGDRRSVDMLGLYPSRRLRPETCNDYPRDVDTSTKARREGPLLIAGSIVVALILATSRWGTNIGIAPLFISDVLIAFALIQVVVTNLAGKAWPRDRTIIGRPTVLFGVFFAYFLARWLLAIDQGTALEWLRDGVPFAYGILALVSAYSLARSPLATRERTTRLFRWALTIHVVWMAVIGLTRNSAGFDLLGPLSSANVFQIRPDIDAALMGIAAALCLRQIALGRRRVWNFAGLLLAVGVVFAISHSRAGQISMLVSMTLAFILSYAASQRSKNRQLMMILAVPVVVVAILTILPQTLAGERLIATVFPQLSAGTADQVNAQGTERARELTWEQVIDWTNEEPLRATFGSGFGNDFLSQSGTLQFLEGTTYDNVRSPHNWFVGIYARMGIVGVTLVGLWLAQTIIMIIRRRREIGEDDLLSMAAVTFVAMIPVASFGVVLESPFGAIPFFWAYGILAGSRRATKGRAGVDEAASLEAVPIRT